MRLLEILPNGDFRLTPKLHDDEIPQYAILSHTWGDGRQEVTFEDMVNGLGRRKAGYEKIRFCGERAARDDLQYFWVDSCCINKSDKAEEQQAINSMFRWYRKATRCYVYLSDVSTTERKQIHGLAKCTWESAFRASKWFTRGWTLQELLAPASVEFFSYDGKRLGDKSSSSLQQQICEVTGVPASALQGANLSQFTDKERFSWIQCRQTKVEEDRAYSLLGIFDVELPLRYGEGSPRAFERLEKEIDKLNKRLRDLRPTDPRDDKKRIEETKGGLLKDSYRWILNNADFQRWRRDQQSRLLWIKGDAGKGKTMLLCGIIDELDKSMRGSTSVSYFFCQATDLRINSATAVLRGLMYMLVSQQPSLISHVQKKYDHAGKTLFEDPNVWVALSDIFKNLLQDTDMDTIYLIVDALDECVTDLPKLLDFIVSTASSTRVKWLLSSRNEHHIEQKLRSTHEQTRLSLELKDNAEQVSRAVHVYIDDKLSRLWSLQDDSLRDQVRHILRQKANGTFLWVALVIQELEKPESWDPLQVVEEVPADLQQLYARMVNQIQQLTKRNSEICRSILSITTIAYRPLHLAEIGSLCGLPGAISLVTQSIRTIVAMCGSFLTIRDDQVYLIHQSAKDYLLSDDARATIFQSLKKTHHDIFSRSLGLMLGTLQRDMYKFIAPGVPIDQVQDPLATLRYSCIHWADHLCDSASRNSTRQDDILHDYSDVQNFLKKKYLYWLEALSLCGSMSNGVTSMTKLEALLQVIDSPASAYEHMLT